MKIKRIISALLILVMFTGSAVISVDAAVITNEGKVNEKGEPLINYTADSGAYATREAKLEDMLMVKESGGYRLWYESFTGEVAVEEIATGNILFTNPYDISDIYNKSSATTREKLLSQIILTYLDNEEEKTMYSYLEAAERGQITMKDIKNGIRVEYIMGEDAIQRLVPRWISVERFERFIKAPLEAALASGDPSVDIIQIERVLSYYVLKDPSKAKTETEVKEMQAAFKITNTMPIYVCETDIKATELKRLENTIKQYCPLYTYEELDYDNQETGFESRDQIPPRFKMALEYTITENGVQVKLPANGISFDETLYQLQTISILPYMGAGSNQYTGYTFLPDGSGTIIRYEDIAGVSYTVSGQMYGFDYAYHEIKGQNTEVMRMPVFGAVTNYSDSTDPKIKPEKLYSDAGFIAIITEGDSMATLTSDHGGPLHCYNSVYATFSPRPSDTYNLADAISTSGDATWTVTSSRRYTDSYTIKYVMLSGKDSPGGYDPTYYGMAEAYRDYLEDTGVLSKITDQDKDIPLFIESFGSIKGTKRVLSFPVTIDVPLTTFEDVQTMASELSDSGITNVNFKLKGFSNGGLDSTAPYKLKWQSVLGGSDGFESLVKYAAEKNVGIYPDFDFSYINERDTFDGVNMKSHAVKTIDNRYAIKQEYDSGWQEFTNTGGIAISSSVYDYFYNKFSSSYNKFENGAISLSTLGSDLNSDFDENDPYHREDSKDYTQEMLASVKEDNDSVMVSGGNAYVLKYADIITGVSLTSSKYINASESIPFTGIVLHGSKGYTGTAINMEGDISEAILEAIENGASIYFDLSYQNTQKLKADKEWSDYYSIAYDIWKEDLIKYYNLLNDATSDLQTSYITGHEFIDAMRVPEDYEVAADEAAKKAAEEAVAEAERRAKEKAELIARREERLGTKIEVNEEKIKTETVDTTSKYATMSGTVVHVQYEGGVSFILNYNSFDITAEYNGTTYTIDAMSFVRID